MGVVGHHLYETILIANQGGVIVDVHAADMKEGIHTMVDMLNQGTIDGFVLDRFALIVV